MVTAIPTACSCGNTLEMAASLAVRTWPNEGSGGNAVASRARLTAHIGKDASALELFEFHSVIPFCVLRLLENDKSHGHASFRHAPSPAR